jgi:hypothetical protein
MKHQPMGPVFTDSESDKIDPSIDFFIIYDHQPQVNFLSSNLNDARIKYFGQNTIVDRFNNQGLNHKDYFFIFDHYLNFDDFKFNGFFYPNLLLKTAINYQKFSLDHKIDFAQKQYSVNCLMNKIRESRLLASCWFSNNKIDGLLHTQSWTSTHSPAVDQLDELLQLGNIIDWTHEFGPHVRMLTQRWIESELIVLNRAESKISFSPHYCNEGNFFNSAVKQLFDITAISVVLEPVFWEHGSMATEKYMHAIYGGTIPLVNGYKIYDSLSTLGFDTFSDIIDTSSQYELNPILRIWNMLENNKKLFSQWQELMSDPHVQNRILNNLTLLQNPEQIFINSLRLNTEQSLAKIVSLKDCLKTYEFEYIDKLNIPDKTNK